jgi:hypothetical protein
MMAYCGARPRVVREWKDWNSRNTSLLHELLHDIKCPLCVLADSASCLGIVLVISRGGASWKAYDDGNLVRHDCCFRFLSKVVNVWTNVQLGRINLAEIKERC